MKNQVRSYMVITLARLLRDQETVFYGINSTLPMLAAFLAQKTHAPRLTHLTIPGGINSKPLSLPHSTVDPKLIQGSASLFTAQESFDLAARGQLDTVLLSATQIDRRACLNMSSLNPYGNSFVRLTGDAGGAFLGQKAKRVLIWTTQHDLSTLVEKVDFCTAATHGEVYVVTPLCLFRRYEGELCLEGIYPFAALEEVKEHTGWDVQLSPAWQVLAEPTPQDYRLLEKLEQQRH